MNLFCQHMTRRRGLRIVRDDVFFFKANVIAHSLRRSSFQNRNRFAGFRFCEPPCGRLVPIKRCIFFINTGHVGASFVSLAPTYFISQSALTPLLLLSKSQPLMLDCDLVSGANLKAPASIVLRLSRLER